MPRGGARVKSGPPPDPNALRRDRPSDRDGWTLLPAGGRAARTPRWPLLPDIALRAKRQVVAAKVEQLEYDLEEAAAGKAGQIEARLDRAREQLVLLDFQIAEQDKRERAVWAEAWKMPQAVVWEQQHWTRDVAQYVRHKVLGELGSMDDAKEARQWSDRLGLNPAAMMRNRWRISVDELGARRAAVPAPRAVEPAPDAAGGSVRDRARKLAAGGGGT